MKFIRFCILLLVAMSVLHSCSKSEKKYDNTIPDYSEMDKLRLDSAIINLLELSPDSLSAEYVLIRQKYSDSIKTEWVYPLSNIGKTDTLLSFLSTSEEHGILPEQFDLDTLIILNNHFKQKKLSYSALAYMEIKASIAYLLYCKSLRFGMFRPEKISPNYYFKTLTADSIFTSVCFRQKELNLNNYLKQLQPTSITYVQLQNERKIYSRLVDSIFTPIPALGENETIQKDSTHEHIPLIAKRLMISGELNRSEVYSSERPTFDNDLLKALNKFRKKNGLYIDQEIGNKTINALNYTFKDYINKIDVNLERLRWKPAKPLGSKFIRINVADMMLTAYDNDTIALSMKVCIGRSPQNKTPFLRSNIFELILNPTWTIPNSIIIKETSKSALKDSTYLTRNKIRIYKNGVEIKHKDVKWSKISKEYQPYRLVQDSGRWNALGRIKFNFANKFNVYLHDTNSKSAFGLHNRAVSHGCIRVQKPLELAFFCLPKIDLSYPEKLEARELLQDKIRYNMRQGVKSDKAKVLIETEPESLKLNKVSTNPSIPIIIEYFSCFTNNSGEVIFRDDIYDLDKYVFEQHNIIKHIQFPDLSIE